MNGNIILYSTIPADSVCATAAVTGWDSCHSEVCMNKSELVEALAERNGLTYKKSEEIVNIIFDSMSDALTSGGRIEIRGFGSFVVKDYQAYMGRNPKTGEVIQVKPKKLPFFKVGKELREKVNSQS
jgi:integration host factor subunit beta